MANSLYDKGRQAFLEGSIAWLTDTIQLALISNGYTPNTAADQFLSDVPVGSRVAISGAFTAKTSTAGVANAASVTLPAVSGAQGVYIVVYKATGTDGTSPLILIIDTATNLPITPNGGDITVQWDSGVNKIFKL